MAIIQDWKIRGRTHECAHTQRAFVDKERIYTAIFVDPDSDNWVRRDYSSEAWDKIHEKFEPQPFSHWGSAYRAPIVQENTEVLGKASAETMLRRMIDENEKHTENARYILALMLERKKTLIPLEETETDETGRKFLVYQHKHTGDDFIVVDPELKLDEIVSIQEEVAAQLVAEEARGETRTLATESEDGESGEIEPTPEGENKDVSGDEAPGDEAPGVSRPEAL